MEPERFAAELIGRLEGVLREREAQEKLEERLKRVRLVRWLCFPKPPSSVLFIQTCVNAKHLSDLLRDSSRAEQGKGRGFVSVILSCFPQVTHSSHVREVSITATVLASGDTD